MAMTWSDGVLQTETHGVGDRQLVAGARVVVAENQRQSSSCPLIFVWDGERYEFVSDILGVGGIGFLVALFHLVIWLGLGLAWWKVLGWW